ncbi:MAG: PQQ-binding-like beta-propeller repeat protein [Candidatus Solibacter usitatus]|nr:PQQ-binding-like beta-propeller repeat protein [Candidatus Solibacter usitatus]
MRRFPGCWILIAAQALCAADWPQIRGPHGHGIADDSKIPVEFSPAKNVLWKTALPQGKSSPVIAGRYLCLTSAESGKLSTLCLDRISGAILWRKDIPHLRSEARHKLNHPASPTPVTDGKNLYVFFSDSGLYSYTLDGVQRWVMPLGPFSNLHGMSASPVLAGEKLLLACDQDTNAFLLAVNKDTGKVEWKVDRGEFTHSFSSPAIYRPAKGPAEVIMPGAYQMTGYSLETGEKLWWLRGLNWQPKSPPIIHDDVLYFNGWAPGGDPGQQKDLPPFEDVLKIADVNKDGKLSPEEIPADLKHSGSWGAIDLDHDGFMNAREWSFYRARRAARNSLLAVRMGGRGDVTASHLLWRFDKSLPDVAQPLLYNGVLFLVRTGGIFTTVNPKSGEIFKQGRLTGALEGYYSSPVAAGGRVYVQSENGKVVVIKATPQWEILAINDFGEDIYATPAIVDGVMYLRTHSALYAIGAGK